MVDPGSRPFKVDARRDSVSSDSRYQAWPVETWVDLESGRVFNPAGVRGHEETFYSSSYDLQGQEDEQEFQVYFEGLAGGIHERIVDFVSQEVGATPLGRAMSVLDVGCGKGLLLRHLSRKYPDAMLAGVEPSAIAVERASRIAPDTRIWQGTLEQSPFADKEGAFDLILANGVLEHVPNPGDFLRLVSSLLSSDGLLFIGVPNFETNVADLLTYDHLTRFTPPYFRHLANALGLTIIREAVSTSTVPMWYLMRRSSSDEQLGTLPAVAASSFSIATRNATLLSWQLRELDYARQLADATDRPLGLFGQGTVAIYGLHHEGCSGEPLSFVFDDNTSYPGATFMGKSVSPLSLASEAGPLVVYLNANPCYHARMRARVRKIAEAETVVFPRPFWDDNT